MSDNRLRSESTPPPRAHVENLGRYRLIARLAVGGMGVIYLALVRSQAGFNKLFVIKELKAEFVDDPDFLGMFMEEARLAAKLNHPNIVQTIEVDSIDGRPFMAMEYLEGQPLRRVLKRASSAGSPVPLAIHIWVLIQVLQGLEYAHMLTDFDGSPLRVVHRDVSPQNVVVTYDGHVKLVDFGIAKALDSARERTRVGVMKGKVAYMAAEQFAGEKVDQRADVFSVGVMLWEVVANQRFWGGRSLEQTMFALSGGNLPKIRAAKPDIDPELERIVEKATALRADDRYASAAEFQGDLEQYVRSVNAPPVGPREVGRLLTELFAKDRSKVHSLIDAQIKLLDRAGASGEQSTNVPMLALPTAGSRGSTESGASLSQPGYDVDVRELSAVTPSVGEGRTIRARTVGVIGGTLALVIGLFAALLRMPALAPPLTPGVSSALAAATALPSASSASPSGPALIGTEERPPPTTSAEVELTVQADPRTARIFVDGVHVDGNPYSGTYRTGGGSHTVRVEAAGYATQHLIFAGEKNGVFQVSLQPLMVSGPSHRGVVPPATQSPPPSAEAPPSAPSAPGKLDIERTDPFAN